MLSKTLIVCLLALFCLQITIAGRLDTRIASPFVSQQGQFPYIAFLQYAYPDPANATNSLTFSATGIIYSATSVITTANVFNNFPAAGANLSISVGAFDITLALQVVNFPATVGTYGLVANGTTPPAVPANLILVPTNFTKGGSLADIATVRLPAGATFNLTSNEVKVATFPTSSPIPTETLYAVAYGNQNPGGPTFPQLKYARMFLKKNNRCTANLTASNVTRPFSFSNNFCLQSNIPARTNGSFNGVCANDIGGAIVRDGDITNPNNYYEVVGLVSWANDALTCNAVNPVPIIAVYLSAYTNNFIVPILGSLAAAGNAQNASANPNSGKGNFICGNGVIDTPYEKCDTTTNPCCNPNTCAFRFPGSYCGALPKSNTTNKCVTKLICDAQGTCATRNKASNRACNGKNTKCISGVCNSCTNGVCTPQSRR